jgi:hypothetical protein
MPDQKKICEPDVKPFDDLVTIEDAKEMDVLDRALLELMKAPIPGRF